MLLNDHQMKAGGRLFHPYQVYIEAYPLVLRVTRRRLVTSRRRLVRHGRASLLRAARRLCDAALGPQDSVRAWPPVSRAASAARAYDDTAPTTPRSAHPSRWLRESGPGGR